MEDYQNDALEDQEDSQEVIEQKLINEEYKIWKKNSPFLYDMIYAYVFHEPRCWHLHANRSQTSTRMANSDHSVAARQEAVSEFPPDFPQPLTDLESKEQNTRSNGFCSEQTHLKVKKSSSRLHACKFPTLESQVLRGSILTLAR
jgi:hypothetical protein